MQTNAKPPAVFVGQPKVRKGLAGIVKRFAAGDNAEPIIGSGDHIVV